MPCSAVEALVWGKGTAVALQWLLLPCEAERSAEEEMQLDASWGSPLSINSGWRLSAGFTRPFISVWYVLTPCRPVMTDR